MGTQKAHINYDPASGGNEPPTATGGDDEPTEPIATPRVAPGQLKSLRPATSTRTR